MRKINVFISLLFFVTSSTLNAQDWSLVWSDEFTNSIGSDWNYDIGGNGWGNNELQYYKSENATIENGNLVITAKKENFGGNNYTSSRLKTQNKISWKYGKIEARIKLPVVQGLWPAFWMLGDNITSVGWPKCGEIDILEQTNTSNHILGTMHWFSTQYVSYGGSTQISDINSYHIFSVEWNDKTIRWFVDGIQYHEANIANDLNGTEEFHNNFFIILNLAVGGNLPGFTIADNNLPAKMYIDYVRVYKDNSLNQPTSLPGLIQAENYSAGFDVKSQTTSDTGGGLNVGWIDNDDWMEYLVSVTTQGTYVVNYRVASLNTGGQIQLQNESADVLATTSIPATGGWQTWATVKSGPFVLPVGNYKLKVVIEKGGFNLNWMDFSLINISNNTDISSSIANSFTISTSNNIIRIEGVENNVNLFDVYGRKILTEAITGTFLSSTLKAGVYVANIDGNSIKICVK